MTCRDVCLHYPKHQEAKTPPVSQLHKCSGHLGSGDGAGCLPPVPSILLLPCQAEIVKRLSAICAQMVPFLTQEVSAPAWSRWGREGAGWVSWTCEKGSHTKGTNGRLAETEGLGLSVPHVSVCTCMRRPEVSAGVHLWVPFTFI